MNKKAGGERERESVPVEPLTWGKRIEEKGKRLQINRTFIWLEI